MAMPWPSSSQGPESEPEPGSSCSLTRSLAHDHDHDHGQGRSCLPRYFLHHPAQPSLSDPSIHQGIQAYLPACLPACIPSHPPTADQTTRPPDHPIRQKGNGLGTLVVGEWSMFQPPLVHVNLHWSSPIVHVVRCHRSTLHSSPLHLPSLPKFSSTLIQLSTLNPQPLQRDDNPRFDVR